MDYNSAAFVVTFGGLPLLFLALAALAFSGRLGKRAGVLAGTLCAGAALTLLTELAGALGELRFRTLLVGWLALCLVAGVAAVRALGLRLPAVQAPGLDEVVPLVALLALLSLSLFVALHSVPNTWDSMTYHLARVEHWVANRSVAPYPTDILRQAYQPPFAEYATLNLRLLTLGDHLAQLVQWLAMLLSLVAVTGIAADLGARPAGQLVAAMVAGSTQMGILQADSTQNDWVLTLWILCTIYFGLRLARDPGASQAIAFGTAVSLAVLTKGTGFIYVLPPVLAVGVVLVRRAPLGALRLVLVGAVPLLLLAAPFFIRSALLFGNPLGPESERSVYSNAHLSPAGLASNLIRDGAGQLWTDNPDLNRRIYGRVLGLHESIGQPLNDPGLTLVGTAFGPDYLNTSEDRAGSPVQVVLIAVSALLVLVLPGLRRNRAATLYVALLVAAGVLFAGTLRWQPWHTRLELPMVVGAAPLVGVVVTRLASPLLPALLSLLLLVTTLPVLFYAQNHPLLGPGAVTAVSRTDDYFRLRPDIETAYLQMAQLAAASPCRDIGLVTSEDSWEYPLWILRAPSSRATFRAYAPANQTANAAGSNRAPCLLITIDQPIQGSYLTRAGHVFHLHLATGPLAAYDLVD